MFKNYDHAYSPGPENNPTAQPQTPGATTAGQDDASQPPASGEVGARRQFQDPIEDWELD